MAKKKSTETSENAVVNQESKEPKKKQEDILLEMIQRYRISHTKNGIFIHIPKTNGKLEAYNLNDSRLKIKLKSMFKDEVGEFPPDAVIQNCLQYTESHAMELPLEEVKYRIASRDKSVIYDLQNGKCVVVNEKGWRIVDNIYPMFLKGADEIEQVTPIHGSGKKGLDRIDRYLNLSPEEKFLLNYKKVMRYLRLNSLVPELLDKVDDKKMGFMPAVELSYIKPKNQRLIAVSIDGEQASPSLAQAKRLRELDKEGKLNGDVIDGILSEQKKEDRGVIISTAELEKYFGKEVTPAKMKEQIMSLLDDWKEKQPPELAKAPKKQELDK